MAYSKFQGTGIGVDLSNYHIKNSIGYMNDMITLWDCLQVSPHEFLQAVMVASKKQFRIGVQSDPVEFISWLLNTLHSDLGGTKKSESSIIYNCFQVL